MTVTQGHSARRATGSWGTLRAVRATATVTILVLISQFVTAGQMLVHVAGVKEFHSGGAIVLHVVAGFAVLAVAAHWWRGRSGRWPVALAAVVFVFSFVQAYLGDDETMWLHVPGALVLTIGAVWLMAWSFFTRTEVVDASEEQ